MCLIRTPRRLDWPSFPFWARATSTPSSAAIKTPCAAASRPWSSINSPTAICSRGGQASPTCTAMRLPRWPCARPMASHATLISKSPRGGRLHSSSRHRTPRPAAGVTHRGKPATRRSSAGRSSPCAAATLPVCPSLGQLCSGCSDYLNLAAADPKKITYSYQPGHASLAGHDRRSPGQPPAPGLAAQSPGADQGRGPSGGAPREQSDSGTSTTGITPRSSCTTSRTRTGSAGTPASAKS